MKRAPVDVPGKAMAGDRAATYGFLAWLCLNPPSDQLVTMIRDRRVVELLRQGSVGAAGLTTLSEVIGRLESASRLAGELEAEHAALFVLPSGVIPHESAHLDSMGRVGTRITSDVASFYDRAGASLLDGCTEMPDHLGIELEFMAFLCHVEQQLMAVPDDGSLNRCISLEKEFLDVHLARWAYKCCDEIRRAATTGFYTAVAHFIADFLHDEEEYAASRCEARIARGGAA